VGDGYPAFPLALQCKSKHEAERFEVLKGFIDAIRHLQPPQQASGIDTLSQKKSLRELLTATGSHYPVLNGNCGRELIGLRWWVT
jgi:hypothetical protein